MSCSLKNVSVIGLRQVKTAFRVDAFDFNSFFYLVLRNCFSNFGEFFWLFRLPCFCWIKLDVVDEAEVSVEHSDSEDDFLIHDRDWS